MQICSVDILLRDRESHKPMGGYLQLELGRQHECFHKGASYFQSARSAFRGLIKQVRPKEIWMPKYICDAMITPLREEGVSIRWYDLDEGLNVTNPVDLGPRSYLLYVNYFGVCDGNVAELKRRIPCRKLIFDFSQSFFSKPEPDALATIYSPRKFFGVPDGGVLVTNCTVDAQVPVNDDSLVRMTHLLKRLYEDPEVGYGDYLAAEISLQTSAPRQMSDLTYRLLGSIDYSDVKKRRRDNFNYLHKALKDRNLLSMAVDKNIAPLCYPYLTPSNSLRSHLIEKRTFVPSYWEDAISRLDDGWTKSLVTNLVPLPIDQRYDQQDMDHLISLLEA